ncbi:endothelial cell-selective adhesion molecule isoform X1 [Salmo trutta]|uniref:Endothelial cell adhesion molecule b n=2 Tax=Salmo trutta TaxID=8032 RepID=A0A674BD91_SALTR|nr:endothelial cell-selective adhesion molecule-like isoform X1 [Salmo trutta]XP_029571217.1 endothelial cell-selective adhesion molecule-like isoform X1 [Salmo trutta]
MAISGRVRALLSLLWVFQGDSQQVEMPRREREVVKGQMVVLQAWYSPTSDIGRNSVIWNFMANDSKQVISYSNGEPGIGSPEFRKRVGFSLSMPSSNLSIYINNTQESDSGRYLCNVIIPGAAGLSGEMRLNVKVPPSPPVCTMTGSSVLNGNVTLSCKSSSGKPIPHYKWTKNAPMSEVFFSPMQNERQGTLRLSNLTKSMSGKYVCRASNTAGSDTCSINLEVFTSSNSGAIAAATLGSIVGLVAIILFLIFMLRRRDHEEEEIANDIKEDAQAPKRVSWAKSGTGSDIISKNGTLSSIATSPHPGDPQQLKNFPYPTAPASDTGSVLNAYRLRPRELNPLQGLPGYISGTLPPRHTRPLCVANNIDATYPQGHSRPPSSNHISGTPPPGHTRLLSTSIIVDTPPHGFSQPPSFNHVGVTSPHGYSRPNSSNNIGAPSPQGHSRPPSSNNIGAPSPHGHSRPPSLNRISGSSPHRHSQPPSSNHSRPPSISSMPHYGHSRSSSSNGAPPHSPPGSHSPPGHMVTDPDKTEGAQPQVPRPLTSPISSTTLARMGAVPVMVPTQSQAGSLV